MMSKQLKIIYDDQCPICVRMIIWLKKMDRRKALHFMGLNFVQNPEWQQALKNVNFNSIMVIENKNYYFEGLALREIWKAITGLPLLNLIPLKWLNFGYRQFARRRYNILSPEKKCITGHCQF